MNHTRNLLPGLLVPGLLALLGAFLVILSTSKYGAGTSPDSVAYISAARSVMSGHGFYLYDGTPLLLWPPFFSTVLALLGLGGVDPLEAVRYVNAGAFGSLVLATYLYVMRSFGSAFFSILSSVAILVAMPLVGVSVFAWSEPLFILFTFLCIWSIEHYFIARTPALLFISGVLAALACLTRYAGLALVVTVLLLLFADRKVGLSGRLRQALLFSSPLVLLVVPWLSRNLLLSGTLTGARVPSAFPLTSNVLFTVNTITKWFLPESLPSLLRMLIVGLFFLPAIGALAVVQWKGGQFWRANFPRLIPMALFLVVYVSYLVISATSTAFDVIDDRLLSPVYPPLILLLLIGVRIALSIRWKRSPMAAVGLTLAMALGAWMVYSLANIAANTSHMLVEGAGGYSTAAWHDSQLVSYLQRNPMHGRIYSNAPDVIYLYTAMPARWSPSKYAYNSPGVPTHDLDEFTLPLPDGGVYLVWFAASQAPYLYNIVELKARLPLKLVTDTSDGSLYQVTAPIQGGSNR